MRLSHLIYVSTATVELGVPDLDDILAVSALRNARANVTGMLLYGGGCFMQVLEGTASAVEATFARVERDARHYGVVVVQRGPIASRSFSGWSMGFRRFEHADLTAHPAFQPFFNDGFDPAIVTRRPGLAFDLLRNFAAVQSSIETRDSV